MLTPDQLKTAAEVHRQVLRVFTYQLDAETFNEVEHWADTTYIIEALRVGRLVGDCDDFALACRLLLWGYGIENRLVLCQTEQGEHHLVCEAGGYVLDNRQERIVRLDELRYQWLKLSGYRQGDPWTTVKQ